MPDPGHTSGSRMLRPASICLSSSAFTWDGNVTTSSAPGVQLGIEIVNAYS